MLEDLTISHGFLKNCTGSAKLVYKDKIVFSTVEGPLESAKREENSGPVIIEVNCNAFPFSDSFNNMCSSLINKILTKYMVEDTMNYKTVTVSVYSNTDDLSMICNSVSVACLDAGIPLNKIFYAFGEQDLFIFNNGKIDFYHGGREIADSEIKEIENSSEYIRESILYSFKDVLAIN